MLRFHLDQGLGQIDFGRVEQHLHYLVLDIGLGAFSHLALDIGPDLGAHLGEVAIGHPERPRELGVHLGQVRFLDQLDAQLKAGGLARHVLAVIVGRKSQFEGLGPAGRQPERIGFELGQHLLLAQHEDEIAGLAAGKLHAVDLAQEIRRHAVAHCRGPFHGMEMLALFAQDFQRLVDLGVAHRERGALDLARANVAQDHLRVDLESRAEFDVLCIGLTRLGFDARETGHLEILFAHRVAEGFLHRVANHLGAHLRTILLGDELQWHLARTKTRQAHGAGEFLQPFVYLFLDFVNRHSHVQAALERA